MSQYINVTFLGTSSGGGPSESRNCSSLVMDTIGDGSLWMIDCAEGTLRQFFFQPRGPQGQQYLRAARVSKVFITHMHADHTMGIITLIRNVLRAPPTTSDTGSSQAFGQAKRLELYGPRGLRAFIRTIFDLTHSRSHPDDRFVVHELLVRGEGGESEEPSADREEGRHVNEEVGMDIVMDEDGFWRGFVREQAGGGEVVVDAGSIIHRDPCIGYIVTANPPIRPPHPMAPTYLPRKVVILGDTSDPSALAPLCTSPSPDLLVHEATDAHIPTSVDPMSKRSKAIVREKCSERGHSTPVMAGEFAKKVGAKKLVLNHLGARFPAPLVSNNPRLRNNILKEMERQATEAWGRVPSQACAAIDFMRVIIPPEKVDAPVAQPTPGPEQVEEMEMESSSSRGTPAAASGSGSGNGRTQGNGKHRRKRHHDDRSSRSGSGNRQLRGGSEGSSSTAGTPGGSSSQGQSRRHNPASSRPHKKPRTPEE
ncbi:hypothetical protein JAAARDRAFT_120521 [Jaapia argillacea MUCL 33604]|uniref:Metallo-beta-lactamase domain-containing protein n=1 Tax=Jaapia argillacea MUCL 33604 TaxID=933084 RepID=A0A067QBZ9_9AGAM|nr:hypothetical protein JAAARDRAFT_120521 [Jaapia argillacea MUCL 33604]